jgi:hypothetical protein
MLGLLALAASLPSIPFGSFGWYSILIAAIGLLFMTIRDAWALVRQERESVTDRPPGEW